MTAPAPGGAPREVAVVGAGLAGLAAAFRLAAAGHHVRVLERAGRAGGRAGVAEWEGRVVDPTAARVTSADAALHGLIREAGLAGEMLPLRPWVSAQAADGAGEGAPPVSDDGWLAIARTPGLRARDALRLLRLPRLLRRYAGRLDPLRPERAAPLDDRSLRDFGELYFGPSAVARWMEPWLAERAPVDEREASRVAFLLRWAAEDGASAGALREPPGLLAELLAARVGVRAGQAAARVAVGAAGRLRVEVEGPGAGGPLEVDAVVLAVPASEARRIAAPLLVDAEHRLLGAVRYDPAVAWIGAARPFAVSVPTRVRLPRATGAAVSMVAVEPGSVWRAGVGAGRVTAIGRGSWSRERLESPDDALAKELGAAVTRWAPGAPEPEPGGLVRRWPEAWPCFDVGAFRALARLRDVLADRRRAGRRLYLAGDWLAAPTLEGAVSSGLRAAADLLTDH